MSIRVRRVKLKATLIAFRAVKPPRFLKGNGPLPKVEMLQRYHAGRNYAHC